MKLEECTKRLADIEKLELGLNQTDFKDKINNLEAEDNKLKLIIQQNTGLRIQFEESFKEEIASKISFQTMKENTDTII